MQAAAGSPAVVIDSGSTAWMLASSALVLLMGPGLALFYGGMVRRKNVLTTMLQTFVAMALIGVQWVLIGFALAFGQSQGGLIGWSWDYVALHGIKHTDLFSDKAVPLLVFVMFQGKFAIITPALISGAIAERMRFSSYVVFILLWTTLVYCPLAHWVWASDGWLFKLGVLDFAGGTVVHIAAGFSALVLARMLGPRRDYPGGAILPNNLVLTLAGTGLLWFGWFGFNAGSAVAVESPVAGAAAGLAFATTQVAAAAGGLVWMLIEWRHMGKPTSIGMASGIVAGLVAITPAAGHVQPMAAIVDRGGGVGRVLSGGAAQEKHRRGRLARCVRHPRYGRALGRARDRALLRDPGDGTPHRWRRGSARQAGRRGRGDHRLRHGRHRDHRRGAEANTRAARAGGSGARRARHLGARRAGLPPVSRTETEATP